MWNSPACESKNEEEICARCECAVWISAAGGKDIKKIIKEHAFLYRKHAVFFKQSDVDKWFYAITDKWLSNIVLEKWVDLVDPGAGIERKRALLKRME